MKKKNNLDEMQEQNLLYVESGGCWLCFWGLLILMAGQMIIYGMEDIVGRVAGEWIMFMCLNVYMVYGCLKNGIWDRRLKPNIKTNLVISAIGALALGILVMILAIKNKPGQIGLCVSTGLIVGVITFALCLVFLELGGFIYRKRVDKLENAPEDKDETEE